ncbi:hypothetical protein GUJ93_ZPchr0006g41049 [Zizania palustris]|uniref:Uncharacterized protein n=1 Tax=Zizania palustris TaxID=103762 RepID=A0A8J5VLW6_ZIZPA|nr:hypothetical protein GUJ93_ZPchr0006g41049 [Zizania palustris]
MVHRGGLSIASHTFDPLEKLGSFEDEEEGSEAIRGCGVVKFVVSDTGTRRVPHTRVGMGTGKIPHLCAGMGLGRGAGTYLVATTGSTSTESEKKTPGCCHLLLRLLWSTNGTGRVISAVNQFDGVPLTLG